MLKITSHKPSRRISIAAFFTCGLAALLAGGQARGAELDWNNTGTSLNAAGSYTPATAPSSTSVLYFKTAVVTQPVLSPDLTIAGFNFSVSGYDVTNTGGAVLTLGGYGTSATGTTASAAAAVYSSGTGTNTFDVPVVLAAANSTSSSTIYQPGAGGSLVFNGAISGSSNVIVNLAATSTVSFNAANSSLTGGITLTGTNVTGGAATLALGNNAALGTGSLTFNSSNATITATGGARTIANPLVLGANSMIAGTNNFTFTGGTTSSGSSTRTLTVNNTGTTTFASNVYLSELAGTGRTLTILGSGAVQITGTVANFNGAGTAGGLTYGGTGILTLSSANTYTGNTSVSGGTLVAAANGALGSGNVSVLATATKLTIGTGVTAPSSNPALTLTLAGGGTAGVADVGYLDLSSGAKITVGTLVLGTNTFTTGTFSSTTDPEYFSGTGTVTVNAVPEPSTDAMIGLGLVGLLGIQRLRRRAV